MLHSRQPIHVCPALPDPVTTLSHEFGEGHHIPEHLHQEDQLVYASRGVMTVRTGAGMWVVPPQRAVWIPARTIHSVVMSGPVSMRTLYIKPGLVRRLSTRCRVVHVSELLRELVLHACRFKALRRRNSAQAHLIDVICDQLETVETSPLQLRSPTDARAARVAELLSQDPGDQRTLDEACRAAGASKRTIERIFRRETAMTLGAWRHQMRLLRSLQLLAAGEKITHVAMESGYSTPSAFITMFKKAFGTTPGVYFAADDPPPRRL